MSETTTSQAGNLVMHLGKNWPKKKATLNQKHRHRATQSPHKLEKLGNLESIEDSPIEVTAEELRSPDPRDRLFK